MLVAHADWGVDPKKRWVATARRRRDCWAADDVAPVGTVGPLATRLRARTGEPMVAGFDFSIGIPRAYATRAGVTAFPAFLDGLGSGRWRSFFDIARTPGEVSVHRPFYPRTTSPKGSATRLHLAAALDLPFDALLRRCERRQPTRQAASVTFWTCGAQQVGRGTLAGWQLLKSEPRDRVRLWPFDGPLDDLVASGAATVAEAYPAEFTHHLGLGRVIGKRRQDVRHRHAPALLDAAQRLGVALPRPLEQRVVDGFGHTASGEDQFDAFVGLLGLINVVDGHRSPGDPHDDPAVRTVEGWILGQQPQPG